ncbi:MAG: trans-aconitate 2-methyltransferase [bacterium]
MTNENADILDHFDELAEEYDQFKEGIPNYREMMEVIQEVFDQWDRAGGLRKVLELGTGTGQLGRALTDAYQPDLYRGLDGSEQMIQEAKTTFETYDGETRIELVQEEFSEWKPTQNYDLIYSSLAIHHLPNPEKYELFETIFEVLNSGGNFLLCDVVRRRQSLLNFYKTIKYHRLRQKGLSESEAEAHWESHVPNRTLASWENLYRWLEEIGFRGVDSVWRDMYRAIFIAGKP